MISISEKTIAQISRLKMAARKTDPETAFSAMSQKEQTDRMLRVYYDVLAAGDAGTTSIETARRRGMHHVTSSPAFAPLARIGLIEDSGYRRINPMTGKHCVVWIVKGGKIDKSRTDIVKAKAPRGERRPGSRSPLVKELMTAIVAYRNGRKGDAERVLHRIGL